MSQQLMMDSNRGQQPRMVVLDNCVSLMLSILGSVVFRCLKVIHGDHSLINPTASQAFRSPHYLSPVQLGLVHSDITMVNDPLR